MDLGISLLGFVVGILVGMTGVGSGSVMTPVLILAGVRPTVAVASDLLYAAITKGVGAIQHLRQGTVNLSVVFYLSLGSVPAGLLGAKLFTDLEQGLGPTLDVWVTRMVAVLLILLSALTLVGLLRPRSDGPRKPPLPRTGSVKLLTVLAGAGVGFLVSITSIGSGSIVAALLLYLYRLPAGQVVGSDIVQAFFLAGAAGLAHAAGGRVDPWLVGNLLLGSIPGVLVGSTLCPRMPQRALRGAVAMAILYAGVRLL
ncbi:MAG: sulfite exporter TauE/SafE family protein [candidate division NC10 bacterium]|nr:sulfite exporter TauE/SafE family protein [candidate division NC10 bacterium]